MQPKDQYHRLLAYVYAGDIMVSAESVRRGYAHVATFPPNVKYQELFLTLQREAREAKRGLWGPWQTWRSAAHWQAHAQHSAAYVGRGVAP